MKLYSTFKKLPLIALMSLGLACSPLVASAGDGDRGRHGQHQQDRGKPNHKSGHRSDRRDYGHYRDRGDRHNYRKGYKHGYRDRHHRNKHHGHHRRHYDSHQRYGHGHHYDRHHDRYYDRVGFMFGLYSDDLDIIFRD